MPPAPLLPQASTTPASHKPIYLAIGGIVLLVVAFAIWFVPHAASSPVYPPEITNDAPPSPASSQQSTNAAAPTANPADASNPFVETDTSAAVQTSGDYQNPFQ